jgi:hypothetical protein
VKDPLSALLDPGSVDAFLYPPNSRYHGIATKELAGPDGRTIRYLVRRFLPRPDRMSAVREHTVQQSDRLDRIAALYFQDPELFWRIADANGAMAPEDLTEVVGRVLRIAFPEGGV